MDGSLCDLHCSLSYDCHPNGGEIASIQFNRPGSDSKVDVFMHL